MSLTAGLTTLREEEIARHLATAQSLVSRFSIIGGDDGEAGGTAIAGTGRRFVPTVSTGAVRRAREVAFTATVQAASGGDPLLTPPAHTLLYRVRRGLQVALAIGDVFSRMGELDGLYARNRENPLSGEDAARFKALLSSCAFVCAFTFASYLAATLAAEPEEVSADPSLSFETPQDARTGAFVRGEMVY